MENTQLLSLLTEAERILEATRTSLDYSFCCGHLENISIYFHGSGGILKSEQFLSESKAIEGIQALITLQKATA